MVPADEEGKMKEEKNGKATVTISKDAYKGVSMLKAELSAKIPKIFCIVISYNVPDDKEGFILEIIENTRGNRNPFAFNRHSSSRRLAHVSP